MFAPDSWGSVFQPDMVEKGVVFMVTDTTKVVTNYHFLPSLIKFFIEFLVKRIRMSVRFFILYPAIIIS